MSLTKEKRPADDADDHSRGTGVDAGHYEVQTSHDRGRRWYHLRPNPRDDADLMGFKWGLWTVLFVLLFIL